MSEHYTLAEARAIIDAEKCVRDEGDQWCRRHGYAWLLREPECKARPEVADVAAQLLATVEQLWALVPDMNPELIEAGYTIDSADVLATINGEEVTE